jgi:hypothetical protein
LERAMINPKTHDSLFKWLITAFTREFFAHYFPDITVGAYTFLDKEFLSKYEALQESLRGDLFLMMEVEINGELEEIVIQIEHQAKRADVAERVYEYACYAWLLRKRPVWSIVVYTDDAIWKKSVADQFWCAFDSQHGKQFHHFDVIKIKAEKSQELIRQHSLLCKMLALKADDRGIDADALVYDIYRAAAVMRDRLTDDHLILLEQWVNAYKKISERQLALIRKETRMEFVATTISEQIFHEGLRQGKAEGKAEGAIAGQISMLETLYRNGMLSEQEFHSMARPLRQQLAELVSSN